MVKEFLEQNDFDFVVRAHEAMPKGFRVSKARNLITLFSAPGYCGGNNDGKAETKIIPQII